MSGGGGRGVSVWATLCIDDERAEWVHDSVHGRDHREASAARTSAWTEVLHVIIYIYIYVINIL